jgi:hypothetical protein
MRTTLSLPVAILKQKAQARLAIPGPKVRVAAQPIPLRNLVFLPGVRLRLASPVHSRSHVLDSEDVGIDLAVFLVSLVGVGDMQTAARGSGGEIKLQGGSNVVGGISVGGVWAASSDKLVGVELVVGGFVGSRGPSKFTGLREVFDKCGLDSVHVAVLLAWESESLGGRDERHGIEEKRC